LICITRLMVSVVAIKMGRLENGPENHDGLSISSIYGRKS
jgi:hypothetical protein